MTVAASPEDFRVRAAAQRRKRMRTRLLDAVMAVYAADGRGERAVVEDVVAQAGVSRGSFYKYFDTLEDAIVEVGRRNADDMMRGLALVFGAEKDPVIKAVGGPLLALTRAAMDPRWAGFTARVDYVEHLARPSPLYDVVRDSLDGARASGALSFSSLTAAMDLAVGVAVQGTRRLARQSGDQAYIEELVGMGMIALGLHPAEAKAATTRAWALILAAAPRLPWWRPWDQAAA